MKIRLFKLVLIVGWILTAAVTTQAVEEQDLIAILQSSAGAPAKCAACQQLRICGSVQSVPVLAGLLNVERVGHAARYALEGMPYPEAGAALRDALAKSSGATKVGLVDAIGGRGDKAAIPLLTPFLQGDDAILAATTAAALGRIGGSEPIAALSAAREHPDREVRNAISEAMLCCAEDQLAEGDTSTARAVYRDLFSANVPLVVRTAAWRGWVLSDNEQRPRLVAQALTGTDEGLQQAAIKLVRELKDLSVVMACLRQWGTLGADGQLAVLDAHMSFGAEARETVVKASQSPYSMVRIAAWQAVAKLNDASMIPALTHAAAQADETERDAACDTLRQIHGSAVHEALLTYLKQADAAEKAEILLALGDRGDEQVTSLLLEYTGAAQQPVRLAALMSLYRLADPETLSPLLDLLAQAESMADRSATLKALSAVCQAYPDKAQAGGQVIAALRHFPESKQKDVLPLLAELGTSEALSELKKIAQGDNVELTRQAMRVFADWPNAVPVSDLLLMTKTCEDSTSRALALRAAIALAPHEPDLGKRLSLLQDALKQATRAAEKRQALSQMAQIAQPQALEVTLSYLSDSTLVNEASVAALSIAEALAKTDAKLADNAARQVLDHCQVPAIVQRAWALRAKPASGGPFIRDWLVTAPYRQPGANGAMTVFNIEFPPEKPGEDVKWYVAPAGDSIALAAFFPGQESCVAYLKAEITAPKATDAILLMGSDDGIKAWLNGQVVHSNNIDRGQVTDQDIAPVKLKQGANDLVLKITQGGGGWSACARLVGADGFPIEGLAVKSQAGAAPPVSEYTAPAVVQVVPKAATLPPREAFKKLCLSEDFYAEGAYYGDFNRDGNMDIVAGPFWYAGPDFQQRHEYRPSQTYDPKGYSDNFLTFAGDFNGDGWTDILCVPFPGKEMFWYANPGGKEGHWASHLAHPSVGNESPVWGDVTGDGRPELLFCIDGYMGYAGADLEHPEQPWVFNAVSEKDARYQRFTHGLGYGDINGDGRVDVLEAAGWWEHTADAMSDRPWTFHPMRFADAAAQMLVDDVNGDGLTDVITAWHCHHYGMVWWEQTKTADGRIDWKQHEIISPAPDIGTTDFRVSQMHALKLIDMNGDGLKDILTGKRFWAHGPAGDKEPDAPAVVFWFEQHRDGDDGIRFVPRLIDDNSGVGTQVATTDLNKDTQPDVIVANKKGIFLHLSQSKN